MKTKETILKISIPTNYNHQKNDSVSSEMEKSRQRIEKSSFYLESLFNLVRYSARHFENGGESADANLFFADLIHVSEIGRGLTLSIFESLSVFSDVENDIRFNETPVNAASESETEIKETEPADEKNNNHDASIVGNTLSYLLNRPELPEPIYNGIMRAVADIENETDTNIFRDLETSPEYLERVLEVYHARQILKVYHEKQKDE